MDRIDREPAEERRRSLLERGGIININKPAGMTSHDVVARVRRLLSVKKVGHTGTLDPMATGVLPVCVGRATRIMEYLDMDRKTYLCTMKLGRAYDTQDVTGQIVGEVPVDKVNNVTEEDILEVLSGFRGAVSQMPPMYSAIKVEGRKLYEYARAGQESSVRDKVKPRQVYIWDLAVEAMSLGDGYDSWVRFRVVCSKGTYIRSICQEAGERLGTGAAMSELVRSSSGGFVLEEAAELTDLEGMDVSSICGLMRPPEEALQSLGEIHMKGNLDIWRITSGMPVWTKHVQVVSEPEYRDRTFPIPVREEFSRTYLAFAMPEHVFLGIVRMDQDGENIRADKIFVNGAEVLAKREGEQGEGF